MAEETKNVQPMKVVTGPGLAYYHEKVKLLAKDAKGVELTQAQYDALSEEEKNNGMAYYIKDAVDTPITASGVTYNDTNVKAELDTLNESVDSIKSVDNVITSANADYAEVGQWADENTAGENRIGYFVSVSKTEAGITMVKATSTTDIRGVTVETPAFAAGASADKFNSEGKLLDKYAFVAFAGFVNVYDNGTCSIGGRCMSDDNGCAIPSSNNMGYEVIDRIDENTIQIIIKPSGDMIQRIKTDITELENVVETNTPIRLTQEEYNALPDTKLTDNKVYMITDGTGGGGGGSVVIPSASDVDYNNETSQLTSTNVQGAIDELDASIDDTNYKLDNHTHADATTSSSGFMSSTDKTNLNNINASLTASDNTKFRFATDGEGNYGYLKADDSFVPFKKGGNVTIDGVPFEGDSLVLKSRTDDIKEIDLPYNFHSGSAIVLNNEIHILGSSDSSSTYKYHYKYNGNTWTSVSTLPYEFHSGSAIVLNNEIHIMGSNYNSGYYKYHYKYDGNTWTRVSTLPYDFYQGCAIVYNNEIHILGSSTKHYKYNGNTWTSVSTLPYYFNGGSAVVLNNEIRILGSGSGSTNHYKYDGNTWTSVSTLPYDFYYGSAVVYNNEIHILGSNDSSSTYTKHYSIEKLIYNIA